MNLASKIINKKWNCIFISPHYDDAILSCGELISQIAGKTNVKIINVFTRAHEKPYTLSARQFLKSSHISDANKLYLEREKEDKKAFSTFTVSVTNLNLEDALFRRKKRKTFLGRFLPEFDHLYPTYRFHVIKKISKQDYAIVDLKEKLKIFNKKNTLVFVPSGIGNHADHLITRIVSEDIFDNIVLYSDFPYNVKLDNTSESSEKVNIYQIKPDMDKKSKLIKNYKTQLMGLFPDGIIPEHQEVYFTNIQL